MRLPPPPPPSPPPPVPSTDWRGFNPPELRKNLVLVSDSPVQLFQRDGDLQVVAQHVQGCEDISPLHHLPQRTPLQDVGTEDVPGLFGQEANMNQNLEKAKEAFSFTFTVKTGT